MALEDASFHLHTSQIQNRDLQLAMLQEIYDQLAQFRIPPSVELSDLPDDVLLLSGFGMYDLAPPLPLFTGLGPDKWLVYAERYFDYYAIHGLDRLPYVDDYFVGEAANWFHLIQSHFQFKDWSDFKHLLVDRFHFPTFALTALKVFDEMSDGIETITIGAVNKNIDDKVVEIQTDSLVDVHDELLGVTDVQTNLSDYIFGPAHVKPCLDIVLADDSKENHRVGTNVYDINSFVDTIVIHSFALKPGLTANHVQVSTNLTTHDIPPTLIPKLDEEWKHQTIFDFNLGPKFGNTPYSNIIISSPDIIGVASFESIASLLEPAHVVVVAPFMQHFAPPPHVDTFMHMKDDPGGIAHVTLDFGSLLIHAPIIIHQFNLTNSIIVASILTLDESTFALNPTIIDKLDAVHDSIALREGSVQQNRASKELILAVVRFSHAILSLTVHAGTLTYFGISLKAYQFYMLNLLIAIAPPITLFFVTRTGVTITILWPDSPVFPTATSILNVELTLINGEKQWLLDTPLIITIFVWKPGWECCSVRLFVVECMLTFYVSVGGWLLILLGKLFPIVGQLPRVSFNDESLYVTIATTPLGWQQQNYSWADLLTLHNIDIQLFSLHSVVNSFYPWLWLAPVISYIAIVKCTTAGAGRFYGCNVPQSQGNYALKLIIGPMDATLPNNIKQIIINGPNPGETPFPLNRDNFLDIIVVFGWIFYGDSTGSKLPVQVPWKPPWCFFYFVFGLALFTGVVRSLMATKQVAQSRVRFGSACSQVSVWLGWGITRGFVPTQCAYFLLLEVEHMVPFSVLLGHGAHLSNTVDTHQLEQHFNMKSWYTTKLDRIDNLTFWEIWKDGKHMDQLVLWKNLIFWVMVEFLRVNSEFGWTPNIILFEGAARVIMLIKVQGNEPELLVVGYCQYTIQRNKYKTQYNNGQRKGILVIQKRKMKFRYCGCQMHLYNIEVISVILENVPKEAYVGSVEIFTKVDSLWVKFVVWNGLNLAVTVYQKVNHGLGNWCSAYCLSFGVYEMSSICGDTKFETTKVFVGLHSLFQLDPLGSFFHLEDKVNLKGGSNVVIQDKPNLPNQAVRLNGPTSRRNLDISRRVKGKGYDEYDISVWSSSLIPYSMTL